MKITIYQTISNVLNEDRSIRSSSTVESYLLEPDFGKYLKNKVTGEIIYSKICITKHSKIADWEEFVIDPKANALN